MPNSDFGLLKNDGKLYPDLYHIWEADQSFADISPDQQGIQVPYDIFLADIALFLTWKQADSRRLLGILINPGEDVEQLAPYLADITLFSLSFPVFTDGRNFSSARLLREKYEYQGEIRAIGDFIEDQLPLLARCGCDAFILPITKAELWWQRAQSHVTIAYQPTGKRFRGAYAGKRRHHLDGEQTP